MLLFLSSQINCSLTTIIISYNLLFKQSNPNLPIFPINISFLYFPSFSSDNLPFQSPIPPPITNNLYFPTSVSRKPVTPLCSSTSNRWETVSLKKTPRRSPSPRSLPPTTSHAVASESELTSAVVRRSRRRYPAISDQPALAVEKTAVEGGKVFAIKSRGAGIGGGGKAPVMLYGYSTSLHTYYLRFALLQKPVALEFAPSIFEMSLFTLEFGKDDVVSGSAETMLQVMDARFPEPPLLANNFKQGRDWDETTPFLVRMSVLQHRSMKWHLERIVRWSADLAARGGKAAVDPAVGTPKMEVRKFGKSYAQLYDVMLEHAQMEEKVVFPILQKEDRGLCKCANQKHARDLPIMNGIKEAIKSIGALDAGTADHREALHNLSSRLEVLQENFREHFVEEERNVFPLLEAVELSKEQQRTTMEGCIAEMQGTHSHLFRFFMEGLQPHEAVQYMDLIIYSMDKDKAATMLCRLVD